MVWFVTKNNSHITRQLSQATYLQNCRGSDTLHLLLTLCTSFISPSCLLGVINFMLPIMFVFRTLAALVVLIITEVRGANPIYKRVGDSVVLNPGPLSDPINSTTWKHKSDLALEWFGTEIICYRDFK
ncbi:hypothetical protein ATANTOWER_029422, partial [Ataeniobius toweri]|nr:hypothetical protein [Ataeniobius toweri]